MKAAAVNLLTFLKNSPQFTIPIYQRTYSWSEPDCRQLWDDILRAGRDEVIKAHFIGSVVYIAESLYQVSDLSPLLVIDGQQRLTTVSLLIEALARHMGKTEAVKGFSARRLRNHYLFNPEEEDQQRYKLLLTQTDRETLLAIVDNRRLPEPHSIRILANFKFFEERIKQLGDDVASLCRGLAKLMLVDISLDRGQRQPTTDI